MKQIRNETKRPTKVQLHIWENDGGNTKNSKEAFVIINGIVCYTTPQKWMASIIKYWKLLKLQLQEKPVHRQHQQVLDI